MCPIGSLWQDFDPGSLREALRGVEEMVKQGGGSLAGLDAVMDAIFQEEGLVGRNRRIAIK
jgi:hypothetical protein